MLRKASETQLAGAVMQEGAAIYLDPLFPTLMDIFVPLVKHFRYSYQHEYRFFWQPPTPVKKVSYVDVCIGSLQDIAELVIL